MGEPEVWEVYEEEEQVLEVQEKPEVWEVYEEEVYEVQEEHAELGSKVLEVVQELLQVKWDIVKPSKRCKLRTDNFHLKLHNRFASLQNL